MDGVEMTKPKAYAPDDALQLQQWEDFDSCSREEKLEMLQKWVNMDVPAIAMATAKGIVVNRPVLLSFWGFGLLIAAFAGGLPVDTVAEEAYSTMLQQAEVIDSRELGQQAMAELQKAEAAYFSQKGLFSCDDECQKAYDKAEEAKKWVRRPCSDVLFRTLQQPQPAKAKIAKAKKCLAVVAQIAKYGQARMTSNQWRFLVAWTCNNVGVPPRRTVQVEESVKFAGETLTVTRQLVPGTAEERQFLLSQKRCQSAKLGGKFAALDNLLGAGKDKVLNTVEKSDLDWQRHQQEAGLQDLSRDPQAPFLRRANLRASEAIRDAARAAARKVQMAQAEVARVQKHRDRVLSEGRQEVGIWSSFGVQDVRRSFWNAWQSGKDFAAQCTFYNVLFAVGGRDESLYIMIFRLIMQYVVNLTLGLIGAFCYFLYNMYLLIVSYGSSVLSGVAFFLLATVAGLSMLTTYLGGMYAVVAGGGAMIIQQAARHAALEMSKQDALQQIDDKPVKKQVVQRRCPV
eukprot:s1903_g4.t2